MHTSHIAALKLLSRTFNCGAFVMFKSAVMALLRWITPARAAAVGQRKWDLLCFILGHNSALLTRRHSSRTPSGCALRFNEQALCADCELNLPFSITLTVFWCTKWFNQHFESGLIAWVTGVHKQVVVDVRIAPLLLDIKARLRAYFCVVSYLRSAKFLSTSP